MITKNKYLAWVKWGGENLNISTGSSIKCNYVKFNRMMYECSKLYVSHTIHRLILIAEKSAVYDRFPTPLINRLEKHFIPISTIFAPWQHAVVQELQIWVNTFSSIASTG